jgi:hypothetical protein
MWPHTALSLAGVAGGDQPPASPGSAGTIIPGFRGGHAKVDDRSGLGMTRGRFCYGGSGEVVLKGHTLPWAKPGTRTVSPCWPMRRPAGGVAGPTTASIAANVSKAGPPSIDHSRRETRRTRRPKMRRTLLSGTDHSSSPTSRCVNDWCRLIGPFVSFLRIGNSCQFGLLVSVRTERFPTKPPQRVMKLIYGPSLRLTALQPLG